MATELIVNGSFETPQITLPGSYAAFNGGTTFDPVWQIATEPFKAVGLFPNGYSITNHLFYPTTAGDQFAIIGFDARSTTADGEPPLTGNGPPYPKNTLSQKIARELHPGRLHKFSFLQSALAFPAWSKVAGRVLVELQRGNEPPVFSKHFSVGAAASWTARHAEIVLPHGGGGYYTIKFTSDSTTEVAIIDEVSLRSEE